MKVPYIPRHQLKYGIKPGTACTENLFTPETGKGMHLAGFDVETIGCSLFRHNDLYSVQIAMDTPENSHIFFPREQGAGNLMLFADFPGRRIFATAHNAGFDIGALLGKDVYELMKGHAVQGWQGKVVDGNAAFLILHNKGLKKSITIADSMSWFKMSLKQFALAYLGKSMQKLERPGFLGKRAPEGKKEFDCFTAYAEQDALIQLEATKMIYGFCSRAGARMSLTPAQLAGRVFLKHYLKNRIFLPSYKLLPFIARCYHGAQFTAFGRGFFRGIHYYDINSLYPAAAISTPLNFSNSELEPLTLDRLEQGYAGFVAVKFKFPDNEKYPCLPTQGMIRNYPKLFFPLAGISFCCSSELALAVKKGCEIQGLKGWGWWPEQCDIEHSLAEFMRDTYAKKEVVDRIRPEELSPEQRNMRQFYKLLLNSLIGKFCQRNKDWLSTREIAGGLFKPEFGAMICSEARAKINGLVGKHDAIYSDTDCLLTRHTLPTGTGIGQLKNELGGNNSGDLLSIRSKLYFVTQADKLVKCAKHGFRQPNEDVFRQLLANRRKASIQYSVTRLTRLKEAYRRNRLPRRETSQTFRIMLQDDGKRVYNERLRTVGELLEHNTMSLPLQEGGFFS